MANAIISANAPELNVIDGLPVVSSLTIAENFDKKHGDVLRDIHSISKDLPGEMRERNFALSQYEGKTPTGGTRSYPMYLLTRDGFTLVAMGFTGKKALAWKVKYIQAFNAMERALLEGKHGEPVILPSGDTLSPAEQAHLHAIVKAKVGMMPKDLRRTGFSEVWARFNAHFQIARYAQLAPAKMGEAVEYLVGMEVKAQKALPTHAEQAAASALAVYTKNKRTSPPDYRTHSEVKARLNGVQRDLIENANTLLACLDNIDKKVLDAFHNPARRGEIATNTDRVLDHFRRSLLRSKEALENQLNACNDTLSGVIGMARILEDPQASGKAVMYGVQTF